jgi:hypothetical protein
VRPGATATRALAQLLAAVGAAPEPRRGQPTEAAHLSDQLAALAHVLDARPHLLFIDDVHHLPAEPTAEALRYLARHVRRSRLFVASRREIALPPDAPPPVVTTVGPLDSAAAEQMLDALAERMQIERPDPALMMQATHGSPFHIRRMLDRGVPEAGSLETSLRELAPAARRVLLAAAVAQDRPPVNPRFEAAVRELEQRFLVDAHQGRLVVHDLIREALLGQASPQ